MVVLNIILINDYAFINGGAGNVAFTTAKSLAKLGDHIILFTSVGPVDKEVMKAKNIEVICLQQYDILHDPSRVRAIIQGIWNSKAQRELSNVLDRFSPKDTIIHIHALSKAVSSSIIPEAKKRGFKIIYHLHDYGIVCPNLGFYNYVTGKICQSKAMGMKCLLTNCDSRSYYHKIWRIARQYVQNNVGKLKQGVDCFIYISQFSLNVLKPYLDNTSRLEFLPNMVNVHKNKRIEAENNKAIIFVGRLSYEKNPQMLARVTKQLGVPVIFIGSGECEKEIKEINSDALITGWVKQEEIENFMKIARVLVFPSKWYEGQPLTIIESKARGIPCLVSDVCAARDEIEDNLDGMLFSPDNDYELKEKLQLCFDDDFIKKMSEYAYKHYWESCYDEYKYCKRLKRIYEETLKS